MNIAGSSSSLSWWIYQWKLSFAFNASLSLLANNFHSFYDENWWQLKVPLSVNFIWDLTRLLCAADHLDSAQIHFVVKGILQFAFSHFQHKLCINFFILIRTPSNCFSIPASHLPYEVSWMGKAWIYLHFKAVSLWAWCLVFVQALKKHQPDEAECIRGNMKHRKT